MQNYVSPDYANFVMRSPGQSRSAEDQQISTPFIHIQYRILTCFARDSTTQKHSPLTHYEWGGKVHLVFEGVPICINMSLGSLMESNEKKMEHLKAVCKSSWTRRV
ncbi:hypothetical protein RRG08_021026 [Elysia crispata]|uniref:Uncharacterized protein n=1 Tax=Elysia crispata TaxID=231223 RepID=A0AAE0ZRT9_9GAST|nr:hypothetical protein RRG08_021026 [Elysia crispata]